MATPNRSIPEVSVEEQIRQGEEMEAAMKRALARGDKIGKLNSDQRNIYALAAQKASDVIPAFRDGIATLVPFYDPHATTAYTDRYCRVGLSPWFFECLTLKQRTTVILHEIMHILHRHFQRAEALTTNSSEMNINGDLEINTTLNYLDSFSIDLSYGLLPGRAPYLLPPNLSMEQYFSLTRKSDFREELNKQLQEMREREEEARNRMKADSEKKESEGNSDESESSDEDGEGTEGESSNNGEAQGGSSNTGDEGDNNSGNSGNSNTSENGSNSSDMNGNNSSDSSNSEGNSGDSNHSHSHSGGYSCDEPTPERENAADEAGIDRISDTEQSIMRRNVSARIVEERQKNSTQAGVGGMNELLQIVQLQMTPPKVRWQDILRRIMGTNTQAIIRGRSDYSYRRVNRRMHDSEFFFPGMVKYAPTLMFGFDTSGSMGKEDYTALLVEIENLIKESSKGGKGLRVFPVDYDVKSVQCVSRVNDVRMEGGGGTDMSVALEYVNSLKKKERPDIFILATDGYTDWDSYEQRLIDSHGDYVHVLLVTTKGGFKGVPDSLKKLCSVLDISPDE